MGLDVQRVGAQRAGGTKREEGTRKQELAGKGQKHLLEHIQCHPELDHKK
jgi:hypothetical protein